MPLTRSAIVFGRTVDKRVVMAILNEVMDPGVAMTLQEMGIVDDDGVHVEGEHVVVEFRPSSPFCPVGLALGVVIKDALERSLGLEIEVRMKRGSHLQESLVNDLLMDRVRYEKVLERLRTSGFVARCMH